MVESLQRFFAAPLLKRRGFDDGFDQSGRTAVGGVELWVDAYSRPTDVGSTPGGNRASSGSTNSSVGVGAVVVECNQALSRGRDGQTEN